jgi:endo-1,4-beta-D-glucanase Y
MNTLGLDEKRCEQKWKYWEQYLKEFPDNGDNDE